MKLDEGDGIIDVETCSANDDVLLTTAARPGHPLPGRRRPRLQGPRLDRRARHLAGRWRQGHLDVDPPPLRCDTGRARRLPQAVWRHPSCRNRRRAPRPRPRSIGRGSRGGCRRGRARSVERYVEMGAAEQFVLTITEFGFGKISSCYEFRISNRGGKGIKATDSDQDSTKSASSSPPSRSRKPTRSCWSPTAAS